MGLKNSPLEPIRDDRSHAAGCAAKRRSMMRIMAVPAKAAMQQWRSKSRATRRLRLIHPMVRSTIQRFGTTTKR